MKSNFKKIMAFVLTMVILAGILAGCGGGNKLVGKWVYTYEEGSNYSDFVLELFKDGTFIWEGAHGTYTGTYTSPEGRIILTDSMGGSDVFPYELSKSTLTLVPPGGWPDLVLEKD